MHGERGEISAQSAIVYLSARGIKKGLCLFRWALLWVQHVQGCHVDIERVAPCSYHFRRIRMRIVMRICMCLLIYLYATKPPIGASSKLT